MLSVIFARTGADMTLSDAQIEAAFERAWFAIYRCSILTTLRRECAGVTRKIVRRAA